MRRRTFLAGVVAGPLVLAACGGDERGRAAIESGELPAPAPGPVPDLPVDEASASNRLPALAVRRVNGEGGWVQLKNLVPAQRPVLFWFWAPH